MTVTTEIKLDANPEIVIYDNLDRKIVLKNPSFLYHRNFLVAYGDKARYLNLDISVLSWIYAVNDEKIIPPKAWVDIERIMQLLGNEGFNAVFSYLTENQIKTFDETQTHYRLSLEKKVD